MTYDISSLALNLKRIRQVPGLGRFLGWFRFGRTWHGYLIIGIGVLGLLMACMGFATLTEAAQLTSGSVVEGKMAMLLLIGAVLIIRAGVGLVLLNRALSRSNMGDGPSWIRDIFAKHAHVPRKLPRSFGKITWVVALAIISVCLFLIAASGVLHVLASPDGFGPGMIELVIYAIPFTIAVTLKGRIDRICSVPSSDILQSDRRALVLFLRSFRDDTLKSHQEEFSLNLRKRRFEDCVVLPNWAQGPVVAIGKPGERLPLFGACREYCPDDKWQNRVLQLLEQCSSVVMVLGVTEGIAWEIGQMVERNYLPKTVFVVPPVKEQDVQRRIDLFRKQFEHELGRSAQVVLDPAKTILAGFLTDGSPFVITARNRLPLSYRVAFIAARQIRCNDLTQRN